MSISSAVLPAFSRRSAKFLLAPAVAGAVMLSGASAVEAAPPRPSAYAQTHPVLKYGSNNSAVTYVQRRLGVRPTSGWFGPRTRAAVVRFQRRHGLAVTGVVGSRMWVKLGVRYVKRSSASSYRRSGATGFRAKVLRYAASHAGKRYVRGGNGPRVFDCSGYVRYVYRQAGHTLRNRASYAIRREVRRISRSQLRPGDLFFVHNGPGGRIGHVGIYAGGNTWWEASNPRRPIGRHSAWSSNVSYGSI